MSSQAVDPRDRHPAHPPAGTAAPTTGDASPLVPFLIHHDAVLQARTAVLAHAYGTRAPDVFHLTRAMLYDRWPELCRATEDDRSRELTLTVVRAARSLGGHAEPGTHRPRAAVPPAPNAALAARALEPPWHHPDPWRLLAVPQARPLRALRHLDDLARDLAVLRWLDVPAWQAAVELGVPGHGFDDELDAAMRRWAAVTAAAPSRDGEP